MRRVPQTSYGNISVYEKKSTSRFAPSLLGSIITKLLYFERYHERVGMVLAVVLGILVGACAFLPLIAGMRLARNATPTSNIGHAGGLLLGVLGSFIILAVGVVVCIVAARPVAVPFVLGEAGALIVAAVVFGVSRMIRR